MSDKVKTLAITFILLPLILGVVVGIWQVIPQRVNEDDPTFQHMMHNIERLAQRPRHTGTPSALAELERVRYEITMEIKDMGLEPIIHDVYLSRPEVERIRHLLGGRRTINDRFFHDDYLPLQNILVRLESQTSDRVVMIVSHYDSALNSPGAADAMLPVAAMLEGLRLHADNENLENNIYFLFTDAEEIGAFGAYAFIAAFPELAGRIDMLINLEAQGNSGGLILFETTPQPSSMLRVWNRAVSRPIGFSIAQPIYETLNTFTDFNFFKMHNWRGVNLAIIGGGRYYHTPRDNFANLNRDTAWHYLTTVLEFTNYVAQNSLYGLHESTHDAVFFTFMPGRIVIINRTLANILCGLAIILAIWTQIENIRKRCDSSSQKNARLLVRIRPTLSMCVMLVLIVLSVVSAIYFNSGSYLFWLPLLFMALVTMLKKWVIAYFVAKAIARFVVLVLWVPLIYLIPMLNIISVPMAVLGIIVTICMYFMLCWLDFKVCYREITTPR